MRTVGDGRERRIEQHGLPAWMRCEASCCETRGRSMEGCRDSKRVGAERDEEELERVRLTGEVIERGGGERCVVGAASQRTSVLSCWVELGKKRRDPYPLRSCVEDGPTWGPSLKGWISTIN